MSILPPRHKISGFTIVRNAQILDYPFQEAVRSVLPLCEEFIINCGDSADQTLELCRELEAESDGKVKIVQSIWDHQDQKGGWQLKDQTDTTMAFCKEKWCFYIQADEAIHESDHEKILKAIDLANIRADVDGILFDYMHFYGSYDYIIRARNWYRHEVRVFKNHRGISAFQDAQGFRKEGARLSVIRSGAKIFHYGYVRDTDSMMRKSSELSQWWGEQPKKDPRQLSFKRRVGMRRFTESHPAVMQERVRAARPVDVKTWRRAWDRKEVKNFVSAVWEFAFGFRIGEFRNYKLIRI